MSQKLKFNIIQSLFRLFSFLADKTGGWAMFVKPKILLGSVVVGLSACSSNAAKQNTSEQTDTTIKVEIEKSDTINDDLCYKPVIQKPADSIITPPKITKKKTLEVKKIEEPIDMVMCYDPAPEPEKFYQIFEVEQKPEPPYDLYKFIGKNLRYPVTSCYENPVQGRVVCSFIVEKDGSISNVEIVKSLDPAGDKEAIRVIESMPNWTPGEHNGEKVRVKYTLPITYKLQ